MKEILLSLKVPCVCNG